MSKMIKSLITIALFSQPLTMYSAIYSSPPNLVEVVNKMKIKKSQNAKVKYSHRRKRENRHPLDTNA